MSPTAAGAPATVIPYSLAGAADKAFNAVLSERADPGTPVKLADIWPTDAEVADLLDHFLHEGAISRGFSWPVRRDAAWQLGGRPSDTFA